MVYPIVYDILCDKFRSTWADRIQQTNITVPQLANLHQWQPQTMKTHLTLGPQYMHSNPNKNRKVNSYSPTEIVMNCCSIFFPHVLGQFLQGDLKWFAQSCIHLISPCFIMFLGLSWNWQVKYQFVGVMNMENILNLPCFSALTCIVLRCFGGNKTATCPAD